MDWWLITLIAIQLAFVAFLIWIAVNYRQKTLQRRSEERLRVVERFNSGKDLSEFLETERGARFLELFAVRPKNPSGIVIIGVALGLLAVFLAAAFMALCLFEEDNSFMIPGILVLGIGLGILTATGVSYRLARKFHLLPTQRDTASELSESE